MTNKEIALSYLQKGLSVIPLWSPELLKISPPKHYADSLKKKLSENSLLPAPQSNDEIIEKAMINQCKIPMIGWKEFQNRLPTADEVKEWFANWFDANIGIVTGKISNLVVFDLDSEHAVEYANKQGGFPETVKVKTGKGYHLYMQHPGFEIRNSVNKRLDLDIRADGGFVVAPPSVHGSGRQYEWEKSCSIFEIATAPCGPWKINYLKSIANSTKEPKPKKQQQAPKPSDTVDTAKTQSGEGHYADVLKNGAVEGMRNHSATKIIGHLLGKGNDESVVWELVRQWNSDKNNPPLDENELRRTFDSVKKLDAKNEKPKIKAESFLDTPEKVIAEYSENYVRIPFAPDGKLKMLEQKMNGGLIGGGLYFWGGIPSSGKTGLLNNITDNICSQNHPVLFFSYDDGVSELRYRSYARFSSFEIEDFNQNRLKKSDIEAIANNETVTRISACKYIVPQLINVEDWPTLIDQIKARHQKSPVIIIDYLRKLRAKNHQADERLRVDGILSDLTNIAKTYNTPILVISELARDSYKSGQRLSMASFKESGSIEYEASWLGILAAVEETGDGYSLKHDWERIINNDGTVDLIVFKTKRGTGETGKVALKMDKNKMTFRDRIESGKLDTVNHMKKSKFN